MQLDWCAITVDYDACEIFPELNRCNNSHKELIYYIVSLSLHVQSVIVGNLTCVIFRLRCGDGV